VPFGWTTARFVRFIESDRAVYCVLHVALSQ
jgi:hypothetical protein